MSKATEMFEELGYRKMVPYYWVAEYYNDSNDSVIQFNANTQEVRLGHTDYDISVFNKEILIAIHEKMKELRWI